MANNSAKDAILKVLQNSPNYENQIGAISEELNIDYNKCVVLCDEIITLQLVDRIPISSPNEKFKKNKILTLSPRGLAFIADGGFKNLAIRNGKKSLANFILPVLALGVSLVTLVSTCNDRAVQNARWQILNDPQMAVNETKLMMWFTYSEKDFKNINFGFKPSYAINVSNNQYSTIAYLVAVDSNKNVLNNSKIFTVDSLKNYLKNNNINTPYNILKVITASFIYKNVGKTNAKDFSITGFIKLRLSDGWLEVPADNAFWQTIVPENHAQFFVPATFNVNDQVTDTIYYRIISNYKNISGKENKDTLYTRYCFADGTFRNMQNEDLK